MLGKARSHEKRRILRAGEARVVHGLPYRRGRDGLFGVKKGSEAIGVTPSQLWREFCVMVALWLLRQRLPYHVRVENEVGLTIAVTMCEDVETYKHNFIHRPRYHICDDEEVVH